MAIGLLYMWLAEFPLREHQAWAWWLFVTSGMAGFGSFLAYLGYGYLDSWHGVATLLLIPFFVGGLVKSFPNLSRPVKFSSLFKPGVKVVWRSPFGVGRALLLATALGMIAGGLTIMTVGMTRVFVPQDLTFIGLKAFDISAINPRLIPLIAHDRAGFGGGIATTGIVVLFSVWCGRPSKSLWQALLFSGAIGFSTAIGVHPAVGYVDLIHLAPALLGAVAFAAGMILSYRGMLHAGPTN